MIAPSVAFGRSWREQLDAFVKRAMDIVLAGIGLVAALPVIAAVAIMIKLDSPGPAVFADRRLGRFGSNFNCYKFRTMFVDADRILDEHLASDPEAQGEWHRYKKLRTHDPRVTWTGKWLRARSVDELPQLWNVLRGDMSLVGPRPYLPREYDEMGPLRHLVLSVPPGITGLWQVSGRNELSFRQRVRLEAWYSRHRSPRFDLWLLIRTVVVVLGRRGAY